MNTGEGKREAAAMCETSHNGRLVSMTGPRGYFNFTGDGVCTILNVIGWRGDTQLAGRRLGERKEVLEEAGKGRLAQNSNYQGDSVSYRI